MIPQRDALVILGVQRTGTALLGQDIKSLGVLGTPGEHLLKAEANIGSLHDKLAVFAQRGASAESDVFAVTLMMNYIQRFGALLLNDHAPQPTADTQRDMEEDAALRFFLDNFDQTTVVTLHRAALWDVAYSTWRVSITNQYHRNAETIITGGRIVKWRSGDPIIPDPAAILACLGKIIQSYRRIETLLTRHDVRPVRLDYDQVVADFPDYLYPVLAAAGRADCDLSVARRSMSKLVDTDERDRAKHAFLNYLGL